MNDEQNREQKVEERLSEPSSGRTPNGLTWPIRRAYWFVEKHLLWPIADSFKKLASGISRGFRYRSPVAYIGATMLLTLTATAIGAAVYFHNEAEDSKAPLTAQVPTDPETMIATTPTPPPTLPSAPANRAKGDDTLKGVVPNFETSSDKTDADTDKSSADDPTSPSLPETVVRPAEEPDSPPLKVAHSFAETFVDYEIGKKGVAADFAKTATTKLSKELKEDPPRQPSNGDIPKATVMNVVKGEQNGDTLDVSVSLMRSGASSELRLALEEGKKNRWLVSEVRG